MKLNSEIEQVAAWVEPRRSEGLIPREFRIFVRSEAEIPRAETARQLAALPYERLQPRAMRSRQQGHPLHHEPGQRPGASRRDRDGLR